MAAYFAARIEYDDIIEAIARVLHKGDAVLVKASRGMKLDQIVSGLYRRLSSIPSPPQKIS